MHNKVSATKENADRECAMVSLSVQSHTIRSGLALLLACIIVEGRTCNASAEFFGAWEVPVEWSLGHAGFSFFC